MKRKLTVEQEEARDARRAKFRALWKQVAEMPETERVALANRAGIVTCDGHPLVGGFRQWLKHGRAVRNGEHGAMIWVPCGARRAESADGCQAPESGGEEVYFTTGTVFDIGQTDANIVAMPETQEQRPTSTGRINALEMEAA